MTFRVLKLLLVAPGVVSLCAFAVLIQMVPTSPAQVPASPSRATTNNVYPVDLPTALRLANAQNLDIQIARERLKEAKANHESAVEQFFPWISPGRRSGGTRVGFRL